MNYRYSVDLHRVPVLIAAPVLKWAWVEKGAIKGFAFEKSEPLDGGHRVIVQIKGGVEAVMLVAGVAAMTEGAYLIWDGALNAGAGAFTNTGATQANHDAVAGYGVNLAAGASGAGKVWLGLFN